MSIWNITDRFSFLAEWFDQEAMLTRKFVLSYYPLDETIELIDIRLKRIFLKRIKVDKIKFEDIFIGNCITIFSRQFKITDYANSYTQKMMLSAMQKVFILIKPDGLKYKAPIIKSLIHNGFKVCNLKMFNMTKEQIESFCSIESEKDADKTERLSKHLASGPVIAVEFTGERGSEKINQLAGPDNPETAKAEAPTSLRALYGTDVEHNLLHVFTSPDDVTKVMKVVFGKPPAAKISEMSTALLENTTCCIVKPHAMRSGHFGDILTMMEENNYEVTAMQMFYLDRINAEEFLEVYNGIVPEFPGMVEELVSGGCVAMEVSGPFMEENPVEFRKLVGPTDPEIARQLRPNTMRAKYGIDKIQNAVHVTDLPEDALLEVEYFFRIMQL